MGQIVKTKNLDRTIMILVFPVFIELLLQTLVGYIDVIMIGRLGTNELATIQICNSPVNTVIAIFTAFSIGCTALITRYTGNGDKDNVDKCIGQTIIISVIISFLLFIVFYFFRHSILVLMGAEEDIAANADMYIKIISFSIPCLVFSTLMYGLIRGMGNTKIPMYINVVQNIIHLILNFYFIYGTRSVTLFDRWVIELPGLNLGIKGAAISTLISRIWCVFGILGYYGFINKTVIPRRYFKPDKGMLKSIMRIGLPASFEQMIFKVGMLLFMRFIISLGSVAVASHAVAETAEMLSFLPGSAFQIVAITLTGQFLGAGMADSAELSVKKVDRLARIFMGGIGLLFVITPRLFTSLFSTDEEVISLASTVLRIEGFAQIFLARFFVYAGVLRGIGRTKDVLVTSIIGVWCVRLVVCAIAVFVFKAGLVGAWVAMFLDLFIRAIIITGKTKKYDWKKEACIPGM